MSRWLYHGLHSLDFPWLYNYRPLWDIVVITFMVGGTALCVTSLILAWRVLGQEARRVDGGRRCPTDGYPQRRFGARIRRRRSTVVFAGSRAFRVVTAPATSVKHLSNIT